MDETKAMLINLRTIRRENGVTQAELAKAIGTTQQAIVKLERCETEPKLSTAVKIAEFFNTSVDHLAGRTEK